MPRGGEERKEEEQSSSGKGGDTPLKEEKGNLFEERSSKENLEGVNGSRIVTPLKTRPVIDPGFISFITISWVYPFILRARSGPPMQEEDMPQFAERNKTAALAERFKPFWTALDKFFDDPEKNGSPNLLFHLFWIIKMRILVIAIGITLVNSSSLAYPFLLGYMINFISDETLDTSLPLQNGYFLTTVLVLCVLGKFGIYTAVSLAATAAKADLHAILSSAILEKQIRGSAGKFSKAAILNLVNQDISMVQEITSIFEIFPIPFYIILLAIYLWHIFGVQVLYTFAALIFLAWLDGYLRAVKTTYTGHRNKITKSYISVLKEFVEGIMVAKVLSLESSVQQRILHFRKLQISKLNVMTNLQAIVQGMDRNLSGLLSVVLFPIFVMSGNLLSPDILFPALILLDIGTYTGKISTFYSSFLSASIGLASIEPYLVSEEIETPKNCIDEACAHSPITLSSLSFCYDSANKKSFKLWCGSLKIEKGLIGLSGNVGSGKSSFIRGLLGFVPKRTGDFVLSGRVAYVSQVPFLMEGTILSNITFFKENIDESLLSNVIEWCSLSRDLSLLPNGIMTKIGEQGVNLSGGQKARICLARALYYDADIYLLDDPLSSSDANVAQHIFHALKMNLKDKTVILATHNELHLSQMDSLINVNQGRIDSVGPVPDYLKFLYATTIEIHSLKEQVEVQKLNPKIKEFIQQEDRETEGISLKTFKSYFHRIGRFSFLYFFLIFMLDTMTNITAPLWATYLSESTDIIQQQQMIPSFIAFTILSVIVSVFAFLFYLRSGLKVGIKVFADSVASLVNAPISWISTNRSGRIVNRMSIDVSRTDYIIANSLSQLLSFAAITVSSLVLICWNTSTPIIPLFLVGMVLFGLFLFWFTKPASLESQRYSSLQSSAYVTVQTETLNGIETYSSYGVENQLRHVFYASLDNYRSSEYFQTCLTEYFELRMGISGGCLVLLLCVTGFYNRGSTSALFISLGLQNALNLMLIFGRVLVHMNNYYSKMNSYERLNYYANELPQEAENYLEGDPAVQEWPSQGRIQLQDLTVAYEQRWDHEIIKQLSVNIQPGEKVGVVGRTGAGKSSLCSAFFRLMEAKTGCIKVDGVDISTIGLKTLRKGIKMVPQEPILFEGTIRSNIGSQYSELELWNALELAGIKDYILTLNGKLDAKVEVEGKNYSHGQRQLLCLARAIVLKPKILIMDEATASIDAAADERIQELIKTHWKDTTVITIAHRLASINAYDKIMVLDEGRLVEFDTPSQLLLDPNSEYSQLVKAAATTGYSQLVKAAATTGSSDDTKTG